MSATAAATLRALATALPEATLPGGVPALLAAEARLAGGVPALEGEPLLSGKTLLANVGALAATLESEAGLDLRSVADTLERSLSSEEADELALAALSGAWDIIATLGQRVGLEQHAVTTLVDHAARPALRAGATAIYQLLVQSRWSRGTCAACGAPPLLAELRGGGTSGSAEHERVLRCARCAHGWSFPRLRCVSCGETNHRRLSYLHREGEGSFRRLEVCSSCNCYIKSVAVLEPLGIVELLNADLATAALDIVAIEHDFHR